jgi:hypothetical protein
VTIDYKEAGRVACKKHYPMGNIYVSFEEAFRLPADPIGSEPFRDFVLGWSEQSHIEEKRIREASGVDEFLNDLKLLCLAHGASICSGNRNDNGGGMIKGYLFDFDINPNLRNC